VQLLTGRDFWTTWPIERIGLRRILVSDGPSGVRGELWDERDPSLNLPSATALAAAWDPDVARRYGAAAAVEARRKGVDVVLGPTINLHRSPLGGRHFEAFSEDPVLTGELAAAYVTGVQDNGVGATPKHYVANDFETERFTADVRADERTLREVYLLAFEKAVTEARAWVVMSAYNAVNGATVTENELLETPLNSEWGFDGVVISDWTAVRSLQSARASQDLAMPGPDGPWGEALVAAVRDGEIAEAVVDRKVLRILTLAERVGALAGSPPAEPVWVEDGVAFAREAAAEGTVLLENRGELPWDAAALRKVAVIGNNASAARTQGGGSATVVPESTVSPLDGLRAALPGVDVGYSVGAVVQSGVAELPLPQLTNPVTGTPGLRARFLTEDGTELFGEDRRASDLVYFGGDAPIGPAATYELSTRWTPADSGTVRLGFALVGRAQLYVDGELLIEDTLTPVGTDLGAAFLSPPTASAEVRLTAGTPLDVRLVLDLGDRVGFTPAPCRCGWAPS
ncbi:glycosyl hydrolase, partial [Modestobacter sp. VKM Ac-2676]